jgi:hypothetical protein
MPKPVKKAAPKKPAAKTKAARRPSSAPNKRPHQLMAAMEAKQATGQPWAKDFAPAGADVAVGPEIEMSFEAQFKARMAELGRKGGKVSGAKRMEMPEAKRKAIAKKAAAARWRRD